MITRIITGAVFVAVIVPCLVLGGWFLFALVLFLAMVASHEILNVPGEHKFSLPVKGITYVYVLLMIFSFFIKPWVKGILNPWFSLDMTQYQLKPMFFLIPIGLTLLYFFVLFLMAIQSEKIKLEEVTFLVTMETFTTFGFLGMLLLRYFPNSTGFEGNALTTQWFSSFYQVNHVVQNWASCALLLCVCFGTWLSDTGAYFVGVLFGKHPMNPRVSPHKTWEGFFGGCFFSYLFFFGVSALFEFVLDMPLVPGLIQYSHSEVLASMNVLGGNAWVFLVIIGLLIPIVGNLGGFLYSLIKRQYAIKDYGKIFPGHGGVIDRFDNVIANCVSIGLLILLMSFSFNMIA